MPLANGFDHSYYLKDQGRFFHPRKHWKDDQPLPPVPPESGYYGTRAVAGHAIEFLKEHAREHAGQPFFQYLAFAAPHFPLQALPEDIAVYQDRYDQGWDVIRRQRWQRQQQLGLFTDGSAGRPSAAETQLGPPYHFPDAFEVLGRYSLAAVEPDQISVHRLVQAVCRDRLDEERHRHWSECR